MSGSTSAASIVSSSGSGSISAGGGRGRAGRQRLAACGARVRGRRVRSEVESLASGEDGNGNGHRHAESREVSPRPGESDEDAEADAEEDDDEDDGFEDSSVSASIRTHHVAAPHEETFELLGNSTAAQLELTLGLYVSVVRERDAWWRKKLSCAKTKQSAWEHSLASAVREGEVLEQELRLRSRKRGSRFFNAGEAQAALAGGSAGGTLKAREKRMSVLLASAVVEVCEEEVVVEEVVVASPLPQDTEPTPTLGEPPRTAPALLAISPPAPPVPPPCLPAYLLPHLS
ncbi:hypothetical protein B0H14DRAFT_3636597 [Mycena olivaceomarginata]|nr:hypothetical protein B0H14DRAFT_3636597 [Mycena olivaceomarginata]